MDHAVRAVSHDRELIRESRIHRGVVPAIRLERHPEGGQELRVGDVLDLGADLAARDLEALLRGEP